MASNAPRGLVPIKSPYNNGFLTEPLKVTSTYTGDIGVGTPIVELSTGFVAAVSATTTASQSWVGVSMVFRDGSSGKTEDILVCTDPLQKYLVQSGVTTNTQALVGASVGFSTPAGVNTTTGLSSCVVAGAGTTAAAPLRVIGKSERQGNDWGSYVDVIVQPIFGLHQRGAETAV